MSLDRIPILTTDGGCYYVEKDKDFGVKFMLENEEEPIWQAAIMDCGDKYAFAALEDEMIRITEFNPQNKLKYKNGESAPLSVEYQIEVKTSYGKTMVVRYLYRNKTPKGVIVAAYSDGDKELTSLAISGAHKDYLCLACLIKKKKLWIFLCFYVILKISGYERRRNMIKTQKKTLIYLVCALVLAMAGILYNGINFPLTNSFPGNAFTILPHMIFVALSFGWVISVRRRILDKRIRSYLISVGMLMSFWLAERTTKWFFISEFSDLCRYLWYAFYIPMILIPLLGVFITTYIGKPETYKMPWWLNLLYIPAFALILFVFTNDFHNLVFEFPNGIYYFNEQYEYGFGFYIVAAWFIILGFYFVISLVIKSRVPGSKTFQKLPLIIMACSVVFWVLYALGLINADLTAVDCLMITLLLESAIQSGLIRSNSGYTEFFEISTVAAQVVDKNYHTMYISSYADDLPDDVMQNALDRPVELGKTMLHGKPVSGGYVFWQNDIKEIKKLMKSLEETRERLSENNFLLKAEIDMNEQKARFEEKNRLYDRIARDVSSQLIKEEELLVQAKQNPEEAHNALAKICVISAYIKRRSNLLLLGEENKIISSSELEFCLRESLDNIRLLGVHSSLKSKCSGSLYVENAVAVYDLFEKTVEAFVDDVNALMVSLKCENSVIKLNLQIGLNYGADTSALNTLSLADGSITCDVDENDVAVYILLSEGGASDD